MATLRRFLPSFAPDYSGISSALFELGGLIVIHDAAGCTENYTTFDEPRWRGSNSMLYCSSLRQMEAIMGDDSILIDKTVKAAKELKPNFIVIIGSPVPMIIGTDFNGIAKEIENKTGIATFGFDADGSTLYDISAGDAFLRLAKGFCKKNKTIKNSINLLGLTPLNYSRGSAKKMKDIFLKNNYKIVSDFAMDSSFDEFINSANASVNVVVSSCGLPAAEWFYSEYKIPYVIGSPIGVSGEENLMELVKKAEETCENQHYISCSDDMTLDKKVLIIEDPVIAESIAVCLEKDFGQTGIKAASPFTDFSKRNIFQTMFLNNENLLRKECSNGYRIIIGDPLFRSLIKDKEGIEFFDLPSVSVSGTVFIDDIKELVGLSAKDTFSKLFG